MQVLESPSSVRGAPCGDAPGQSVVVRRARRRPTGALAMGACAGLDSIAVASPGRRPAARDRGALALAARPVASAYGSDPLGPDGQTRAIELAPEPGLRSHLIAVPLRTRVRGLCAGGEHLPRPWRPGAPRTAVAELRPSPCWGSSAWARSCSPWPYCWHWRSADTPRPAAGTGRDPGDHPAGGPAGDPGDRSAGHRLLTPAAAPETHAFIGARGPTGRPPPGARRPCPAAMRRAADTAPSTDPRATSALPQPFLRAAPIAVSEMAIVVGCGPASERPPAMKHGRRQGSGLIRDGQVRPRRTVG